MLTENAGFNIVENSIGFYLTDTIVLKKQLLLKRN